MTRSEATTDDRVGGPLKLEFPAQRGYLKVCRLAVAALAAEAGFDVDELDDLRLAVTEAVTWLVEGDRAADRVTLVVELDRQIVVDGTRECEEPLLGAVDDLLHAILGATLDEYHLGSSGDRRTVRLVKHPAGT